MTLDEITLHISKIPDAMKMGDASYWKQVVSGIMPGITEEIGMAYDWDFIFDVKTITIISGVATYTITGTTYNIRDIQDIRYGNNEVAIPRMRIMDALDFIEQNQPTSVQGWYVESVNKNGYPVVRLVGTPTEDTTMKVRYRRRDIPFADFPAGFGLLFVSRLLAEISPERTLSYKNLLKLYIKRYHVGGKDYMQLQQDPQIVAGNRYRASLYGTG
jgi:hypothetical protein